MPVVDVLSSITPFADAEAGHGGSNVGAFLDVRKLFLTGGPHVDDVHPVLEHASFKVMYRRG